MQDPETTIWDIYIEFIMRGSIAVRSSVLQSPTYTNTNENQMTHNQSKPFEEREKKREVKKRKGVRDC